MKVSFEIRNKQTNKVVKSYDQEWEARLNCNHDLEFVFKKEDFELGDTLELGGSPKTIYAITNKKLFFTDGSVVHKVNL